MSKQATMTSFFGASSQKPNKNKKKTTVQSKLSFAAPSKKPKKTKTKADDEPLLDETMEETEEEEEIDDDDDDEQVVRTKKAASRNKECNAAVRQRKKRRILDDDDSDDDDDDKPTLDEKNAENAPNGSSSASSSRKKEETPKEDAIKVNADAKEATCKHAAKDADDVNGDNDDDDDKPRASEKTENAKTTNLESPAKSAASPSAKVEDNVHGDDDESRVEETKKSFGSEKTKKAKPVFGSSMKAATSASSKSKKATPTTKKEPVAVTKAAVSAKEETSGGSSSLLSSEIVQHILDARPAVASGLLKAAAKEGVASDEDLLVAITSPEWVARIRQQQQQQPEKAPAPCLPYLVVCQAFNQIEATTKRLEIQVIMTKLFRQLLLLVTSASKSKDAALDLDLAALVYLSSNSVAPAYDCVELGIGDSLLIKAVAEATGATPAKVKERYEKEGDLGTVAMKYKGKQRTLSGFFATKKPEPLTAHEVLTAFREIADTKGRQAQKWKVDKIKKLIVASTDATETKYLIRGLQGKLRIGLAASTVLISLAHALALTVPVAPGSAAKKKSQDEEEEEAVDTDETPPEVKQYLDKSLPVAKRLEGAVNIVKKAYSEVPSYDKILTAALQIPLEEMHKACTLTPGIPVEPMLAKPTKSIQEVLKRLNGQKFTCEYKYDGERAQVHLLPDGTTNVFSRNLLDTSEKFPELPIYVQEACQKSVKSFVMDTEVVAYNAKTGQLVPFQVLSTRKKTEESAESAQVKVIVQAFDLMYLNGASLLHRSLAERRALLKEHFQAIPHKFQFAVSLDHEENGDTTVLEEFLDNAVKGQCEGLMVKTLEVNAIYEPSRRSLNWLKLKKDYLEGLGDSVDLVPLGAYHGRGKRTGVYGAYLLACYDADTEEFQSVCKIGTGFSDEDLQSLAKTLNEHIIPTKSSQYNVADSLACDVWFDAVQVWEVKAADLSKSSLHRGAEGKTGEEGRGIGLRFPRFERVRPDKSPQQATTSDQVLELYYNQDSVQAGGDDGDDDDL